MKKGLDRIMGFIRSVYFDKCRTTKVNKEKIRREIIFYLQIVGKQKQIEVTVNPISCQVVGEFPQVKLKCDLFDATLTCSKYIFINVKEEQYKKGSAEIIKVIDMIYDIITNIMNLKEKPELLFMDKWLERFSEFDREGINNSIVMLNF